MYPHSRRVLGHCQPRSAPTMTAHPRCRLLRAMRGGLADLLTLRARGFSRAVTPHRGGPVVRDMKRVQGRRCLYSPLLSSQATRGRCKSPTNVAPARFACYFTAPREYFPQGQPVGNVSMFRDLAATCRLLGARAGQFPCRCLMAGVTMASAIHARGAHPDDIK
jgi:hypothetical protein